MAEDVPRAYGGGKIKTRHNPSTRKFSPYTVTERGVDKKYDRILGTLYGHVVGDAVGHLTEGLSKEQAQKAYGSVSKQLELVHKKLVQDTTRKKWALCDWTEESDMMLIVLESLIYRKGKIDLRDLAKRFMDWCERGFQELNDVCGQGLDSYTKSVIAHAQFSEAPKDAAVICWRNGLHQMAAGNAAVARTSVLGVHMHHSHAKVIHNTTELCALTHPDPQCQASCVAVTTAISLMMQKKHLKKNGQVDVDEIINESYSYASYCLVGRPVQEFKSLKQHMTATALKDLKLSDISQMSFTYKALGAGFWALKQKDYRTAIQDIVMQGGDADANAAVAGAMLGCKLGYSALPASWLEGLCNKGWLDDLINRYLHMMEQKQPLQ
ncbi:unnamed protein product [Candidula unifasciata]|uniref:Uncharacterized protein n=1 Tax=Candidula unifasciata TaxID=100452 RepID=A0A8S3ZBY9_9EUPU|nr:unnamed protein product [Candidula unifasciata]